MEDESCTHSPPLKKICADQNLPEPFTLEELSKLLNVCIYRQELAAVNQELDLLDDITTNCTEDNVVEQSVKQESTARSFALPVDQMRSDHLFIYIPPKKEEPVTSGIHDSKDSNLSIKQEPVSSCPEIALDAKREASVLQQVARLHRKGLWSSDRLPKVMEPRFGKMHHVHLLNEALWLSTDFREERKWKKDMAIRLARAAQAYLITRHEWNQQIQYFEEQLRMRNAARVAKMIKDWWSGINQSLDILRMKLHHKRWEYACKENQDSVVQFSDTSLSWWAALKFDFKNEKFQKPDLLQISPDEKILSYVDGDGDMDDEDWKPEIESESSTVSDSCSSSTSSSLASSFLDDSDVNAPGVTAYSPSDPLSSEHYHSEITTPIAFNQNDRQLGLEKEQKNQEMLPHDSDCESRDGSNASHNASTEETQISQASPEPGDSSVESIEVQHLMSDTKVPLNHLLETYLQQGLFTGEKVKCEPGSCSSDSDTSNGEVDCHTYVELPKRIQEEISILQKEASLPLLEVLPAGYMNFLESADTHKCPAERATLSPSQKGYHHLDESPQADIKMDSGNVSSPMVSNTLGLDSGGGDPDSASSESEASSLISGENNESDQLLQSEDEFSTNNRMVCAPWYSSTLHSAPRHITDLHTAAVELLSLKLTSMANNDLMKYISETCTVAHGPTLRIRSLPTANFGAAVTWMRHAFARSVPVLLLTNSHLSGDAELAVAAHLGQLAVADPRYYMSSGYPSNEFANDTITGEWGPHLIVTPSLCLSAWRKRLQIWCPGLRVTCLGLARKTDRSGTGNRLRDSVARGAVNICLVSYSALRSRPSRFTRIQWSSVVFDQMQHIILQSFKSSGLICTETPNRQRTIKKLHSQDFTQDVTSDCEAASCDDNVADSLNTRQLSGWSIPKTSESIIRRKLEWFDLILNKLGRNGHRLLISSSADLIYHKHSPYLLDLSKLLLLKNLPDEENYRSWLNDFFQAVNLSASHCRPSSTGLLSKPSKKQLFKFLDPFVIRFDDEEEWDSFINEEVIECRMSTIQQKLHDAALSTKAAENAMKTGNLMDLLQTVSIAARTCSHPCLTGTQPKNSRIFRRTINNLQTRNNAAYGPCVFNSLERICDSNRSCYPNSSLIFSTPESVLFGVKLLRQSELSYTSCQYFNLFEALKSSVYVRNRIASLTPQFIDLVSTPKKQFTPPSGNVSLSNSVSVPTNSSPVSHIPNGNSGDNHFKSENHLTNGLPQSQQPNSENCIDPDIEFVSIPQRQKRQRENSIDHSEVSNKRRRIEDTDIRRPFLVHSDIQLSSYYHAYSNRSSQHLSCDSNMSSDQLRNTNVSSSIVNHISNSSTHNVLSDSNERSADISVNADEYPWLKDNQRKCTQLTGFADWCSLDTCNMLRLDKHLHSATTTSTTTAMTSTINSSSENSSFQSYNVFTYEKESSIWNIVKDKFSLFWTNPSILCTRPRVIATPARLTSRIGPVDLELLNKNKSSLSLIDIHCPHVSWPMCMHHSTVLKISRLLYPLTEQARLLSMSSVPNIGFQPSLSSVIRTKIARDNRLSPLCRLFSESGKFYHLHKKLSQLLGVKLKGEKRPRCIYFIAHQTAFLDLLEAYLSVSSWRLLCRLRIPSDYQSVSANTCVLLDRINYWPYGTMGPLLVLIHARSPASLLVSLRADPGVHIIICDVDWRTEVTDNLKAIIHSWVLNGLSSFPSSTEYNKDYNSGIQKVNTYRLLSSGDFGYSIPRMTVEACLLRGVACRLLPRAVFHAHSTTHVNRSSLLFARVQPNVVNGLLSGVYARKLTHRSLMQKIKSGEIDRLDIFNDRNFFAPIKQDTLSYSSASSIASSFSCTGPDNRLDEFGNERTGEEDDVILFQEREPLSEQLLHRALELFEDPTDTQAWCCTNAERKAIANEFIPIENEIDDSYSISSDSDIEDDEDDYQIEDESDEVDDSEEDIIINDELITSELNTDFIQSIEEEYKENSTGLSQSDLSKQLGYSDLIEWEFANYELLTRISDLEDQLYPSDNDWLTYHYPVHENFTPDPCEQHLHQSQDVESTAQTFPPSLTLFSQLPVWCPFESHLKYLHTESNASESSFLHLKNECELPLPGEDSNDWISSNLEFDWGYETVPMAESELPPLIIAPVVQNNITTTVSTTTKQ
ncbi:unnamed protein product [Trichobilharzia szidati]|nr:unnamed protein product [Trichobilharzia szidati]